MPLVTQFEASRRISLARKPAGVRFSRTLLLHPKRRLWCWLHWMWTAESPKEPNDRFGFTRLLPPLAGGAQRGRRYSLPLLRAIVDVANIKVLLNHRVTFPDSLRIKHINYRARRRGKGKLIRKDPEIFQGWTSALPRPDPFPSGRASPSLSSAVSSVASARSSVTSSTHVQAVQVLEMPVFPYIARDCPGADMSIIRAGCRRLLRPQQVPGNPNG